MEDSARAVAEAMHDWRMKQPRGEVEDAQLETMAKFREAEERLRFANHNLGDLHAEYKKMAQRKERLLTRIQRDMLATSTTLRCVEASTTCRTSNERDESGLTETDASNRSSIKRKLAKHIQEPTFSPLERRLSIPTTSSIAENEAAESDEVDTAQLESASVSDASPTLNSGDVRDETRGEEEHESERLENPAEEGETARGLSSTEEQLASTVDSSDAQLENTCMPSEPDTPATPVPRNSSSVDSKDAEVAEIFNENNEGEGDAVASTPLSVDLETEIPTHAFAHLAMDHETVDDSVEVEASGKTRDVSPVKTTQGMQEFHMASEDPTTSSQHPESEVSTQTVKRPQGDPEDAAQDGSNPKEELCLKLQEVSTDEGNRATGE